MGGRQSVDRKSFDTKDVVIIPVDKHAHSELAFDCKYIKSSLSFITSRVTGQGNRIGLVCVCVSVRKRPKT